MNADVFRLIKIYLIEIFSLNSFRTKDSKSILKAVGMTVLYLFLGGMIAFYIAVFSFLFAVMDRGLYIFPLCGLVSFFLTFLTVLFKSPSFLYGAKDTAMLSAMPIRSRDFILARLSVLYLFELPFHTVLFLPALIVYALVASPPVSFYGAFLVGFCFLPVVPFFLAVLFGVLIAYIASRFRFVKAVSIVLLLALLAGFLCLLYNPANFTFIDRMTDGSTEAAALFFQEMIDSVLGGNWFFENYLAVFSGSVSSVLLFVGVSLALAVLVCLFLFRNYLRFVDAIHLPFRKKGFKREAITASAPVWALYRRERKRYFSSVSYVVNTLTGSLFLVIASVAALVVGREGIRDALDSVLTGLPLNFAQAVPILMCFFIGMAPTTAVSLSLEGKNFWILQTLPVTPSAIYFSKVLVCLTTTLPAAAVSSVFLVLAFRPGWVLSLMFVLIPLSFSVFSAYFGLWLNSHFLKLDWTNETQIVKQSPPVMITSVVTMLPVFACTGLVLFLPEWVIGLVYLLLFFLLFGLAGGLAFRMGKKPLHRLG